MIGQLEAPTQQALTDENLVKACHVSVGSFIENNIDIHYTGHRYQRKLHRVLVCALCSVGQSTDKFLV